MWMQAQNLVPVGLLDWNAPLGALLVVGLLIVAALGVLFESGAFGAVLRWVMGDEEDRPAVLAVRPQRGRA